MSDSVQSSNRKLSDEAKQLEKAGQFAEAADLYKQVHDSYPGIRLIHFADIHLGFTGPTNLVLTKAENAGAAGRYVREVDIEESVKRMTRDLGHAQPAVDMVVIAGDLFHRSVPYPHAISFAAKMIRLLRNYDIPVVIIDGNHETASILLMGSPTAFLRELNAH